MASVSLLKLSVWTYLLIQQSTSAPLSCDNAPITTTKIWGKEGVTGLDLSQYTDTHNLQWIGCYRSACTFSCVERDGSITFGSKNENSGFLSALLGNGNNDIEDSNGDDANWCYTTKHELGELSVKFDIMQLCKQLGYSTGTAVTGGWTSCAVLKWDTAKKEWFGESRSGGYRASSITCKGAGDIDGYTKDVRDEMAIPVAPKKSDGTKQDTRDQEEIPRLMEAVSYLDFRQKVIDGFPDKYTVYTFIIRAETPYTIEYINEDSLKKDHPEIKYGHTSMLTKSERDVQNEEYSKRTPVVIFAGTFFVDGDGYIYKWNCQSGHFNPSEQNQYGDYVPVDSNENQGKLWDSAPIIAKVFGFPEGKAMECKSKSSSSLTMDYWNEYGDDAFDDDRLFEEYDRIITDYLLSQEARDNLKRAPWTVALTGKDLIILLLMALTVVTIMAVCCECARTKGYGTTNYKVVRTVYDSEMDSEEITLQQ